MKKFFKIFLALIFLSPYLLISLARPAVAAVPGEGLTISPPIFELTLKPGESSSQTIKITNPTQKLMEIYPLVMNFRASGEGGEPAFYPATSEEEKFSLASWIKFNQTKLALTPEQVVEFKYQIQVPNDAEPGGHYGVVFFATEPPKPEQDISQVAIASMIGSLILAKTPGEIIEKGLLEEFVANKFYLKVPVEFTTKIQNTGNIHFKPQGEITIKNWQGKIVDKVAVNLAKGNILPDSTRKFEEKWSPSKWSVGKFTADLSLTYGEPQQNLSGDLSFWLIPLWFIILIGLILLIIIVLIIWKIKRKNQFKAGPPRAEKQPPERQKIILR